MIVRRHRFRAGTIGVAAAGVLLATAAAGQTRPAREDECRELTGAERAKCEQRINESSGKDNESSGKDAAERGPSSRADAPRSEADRSEDSLEASRAPPADEQTSASQPPSSSASDEEEEEEPPPDTRSESDEQSDTADPPRD